jgi:5-methylcytosine-specific restriction endonuclease McrA
MSEQLTKSPRRKLSPAKYRRLCEYVFNRDQFCVFCGTPEMPTNAHIVRRSAGGHDAPNNIVRACLPCHFAFDSYRIELPEAVREMLKNEPSTIK